MSSDGGSSGYVEGIVAVIIAVATGIVGYLIAFVSLKSRFEEHLVSDEKSLDQINLMMGLIREDIRELRKILRQEMRFERQEDQR